MARPSNTSARQGQIIVGAIQVFATSGYRGSSVQAIAKAAGLTPGLLHYHFGSKVRIGAAAIHALASGLVPDGLDSAGAPDASAARDLLDRWLDAMLGLGPQADPQRVRAWVVLSAAALSEPDLASARREALAPLNTLLDRLLVAVGAPPMVAGALMALIEGWFQLAVHSPERIVAGTARWQAALALDAWLAPEAS